MRQLQIKDGKVLNEWVGTGGFPQPPDSSWTFVDVTNRPEAKVGGTYDSATDTFTPPPAPADYGATVGPRAFLQLFTRQQFIAIKRAANTDEVVEHFMALAQVPEPIRLKHPTTLGGLQMLVAKGLLTQSEATRISNNQPPA